MNKEKIELYNKVLAQVLEDFELDEAKLFSSNKAECVQARVVLVQSLATRLSDDDIAACTHKMRRCSVCAIRNKYREECADWSVRHCIERLRKGC